MDKLAFNDRDFVGANVRRIARSMGLPAVTAELAVDEALGVLERGSDRYVAVNVGAQHCGRVRVAHVKPLATPAVPFRPAYQPCPRGGDRLVVPQESINDPSWLKRALGALVVIATIGAIWFHRF